jgi:ABC-type uncharacterized transport system permease subunit
MSLSTYFPAFTWPAFAGTRRLGFVVLPLAGIAAALVTTAVLVWIAGANPLDAASTIIDGAFGTTYATGVTLVKATTLLLAGLAVGVAYRAGLVNIGAEGQLQMGAAASAASAIYLQPIVSGSLLTLISLFAGFVAGAIWSGIAGFCRAFFKSNELVTTILLNYIALAFVSVLVSGPMAASSATFRESERIPANVQLPKLIPGIPLHAGFIVALLSALLVGLLFSRTTLGFVLQVVRFNPFAARSQGWSINRMIVLAMLFAGGFAGLAGSVEVLGVHGRLIDGFSPGYGYLAIGVSFLALHNSIAMIPSAVFFGAGITGMSYLQRSLQVPSSTMFAAQGVLIMFVAAGTALAVQRARQSAS